jgi:uncharacterized protein with HEPN domain
MRPSTAPGWPRDKRTSDAVALRVLQVGERAKKVSAGTLLGIPDVPVTAVI